MERQQGFTLIEILVMTSILVIASVIATGIFFTVLRSNTKSRVETKLKEKGQFVTGVLERMVRNATGIADIDTYCTETGRSSQEITIVARDGLSTRLVCDEANDQIASESANSAILLSGVDLSGCNEFITCQWNGTGPPKITIKFSLTGGDSSSLPYQSGSLDFQTIVVPRNIR